MFLNLQINLNTFGKEVIRISKDLKNLFLNNKLPDYVYI